MPDRSQERVARIARFPAAGERLAREKCVGQTLRSAFRDENVWVSAGEEREFRKTRCWKAEESVHGGKRGRSPRARA